MKVTTVIGEAKIILEGTPKEIYEYERLDGKEALPDWSLVEELPDWRKKEFKKDKVINLNPTINITSSNEGEIKRMVQKSLNESYEMLEKTYGDK